MNRCQRCGSDDMELHTEPFDDHHVFICNVCRMHHDADGEVQLPTCDECERGNVISQMNIAACYLGGGENGGFQTILFCRPCSKDLGIGDDTIFGEVRNITRLSWWIARKFANSRVDVWDKYRGRWIEDCGTATGDHLDNVRLSLDGTGMIVSIPYHLVRFAHISDTERSQS